MIKSIKVMLVPNNKQATRIYETSCIARFAYNWCLGKQQENYNNGGKFISHYDMRKQFTQQKQLAEFKWLNNYSTNVTKQAIKDACSAYERFFKKQAQHPKFKSKKKSKPSFFVDTDKIKFTNTHVKLEKLSLSKRKNRAKLNWVRLAERGVIPTNASYINPRVSYDGLNWWLSVGIECEQHNVDTKQYSDGIGIDLGIKDLAVCSNGSMYQNINKTNRVRVVKKKVRKLQRSISRKYLQNKKGDSYRKTSNIIKGEKQLLRLTKQLTNIRHDYLHKTTREIINGKPKFIVLEDLNISGMMKNRHLSKAIQEQLFGEFYRQIQYKSEWNGIRFVTADRYYPSSKLCSVCGQIKKDLKLSDRTYRCDCGNVIDRDLQASINLAKYGELAIA